MDRQWAAGLRAFEIVLAQLISNFIVLLFQILCLLFVALVIFKLPLVGKVLLATAIASSCVCVCVCVCFRRRC